MITQAHGLKFPLKFSSHLDELNVISVLSLLDFGSGYRAALHAATGRGAWDNMRALVLALYLGSTAGEGDLLSAKGMQGIQLVQVAQLLRVEVHVERQHETLVGVTMGELGGPMYELVKLITDVLNETGGLLVEYGYPNLGSFVLKALEEGRKTRTGERPELEIVLEQVSKPCAHGRTQRLIGQTDSARISRLPGHGDGQRTACLLLQEAAIFDTRHNYPIWEAETNTLSYPGKKTQPCVCRQRSANNVASFWGD